MAAESRIVGMSRLFDILRCTISQRIYVTFAAYFDSTRISKLLSTGPALVVVYWPGVREMAVVAFKNIKSTRMAAVFLVDGLLVPKWTRLLSSVGKRMSITVYQPV